MFVLHQLGHLFAENTNLEDVCEDLFGLPVEVGVDEGHVIVACYHVPKGRQSLLHTLDLHCVRQ